MKTSTTAHTVDAILSLLLDQAAAELDRIAAAAVDLGVTDRQRLAEQLRPAVAQLAKVGAVGSAAVTAACQRADE